MKKVALLTLREKIRKVLINYFTTQFVLMIIVGLTTWGILTLLNLKYALVLAILTGVLSAIPNFGILVATVVASLVAVFDQVVFLQNTSSIIEGIVVLLIFVLLNKLVDLFLAPFFLGKTNNINPLVVFLVTLLGTIFFGIWGAIFAMPVFLIAKTVLEDFNNQDSRPNS